MLVLCSAFMLFVQEHYREKQPLSNSTVFAQQLVIWIRIRAVAHLSQLLYL